MRAPYLRVIADYVSKMTFQQKSLKVAFVDPDKNKFLNSKSEAAQRFFLCSGGMFCVLPGNMYWLQNHSENHSFLKHKYTAQGPDTQSITHHADFEFDESVSKLNGMHNWRVPFSCVWLSALRISRLHSLDLPSVRRPTNAKSISNTAARERVVV